MSAPGTPVALSDVRQRFEADVQARLDAALDGPSLLARICRYHMATGGKRLRALLPIWFCINSGGRGEDAIDFGVGVELLHNATLIHDDLQDGDRVRRGQPAVWTRWGAAQAINAGNSLFFVACRQILKGPHAAASASLATEALAKVAGGQALEFQLQLEPSDDDHLAPTMDNWVAMAHGKTAAMFALCLRGASLLAGGSSDAALRAARWGESLGLLFQVQDDYLDLVGDKGRDQRATDIAEGKISFPVAWAMEHATEDSRSRLDAIVRTPRSETSPDRIAEALAILGECGALKSTAAWITRTADRLKGDPESALLPGLVDWVLKPVAHAL